MKRFVAALFAAFAIASAPNAGELVNGVLTVGGKPFYPLGGWDFGFTRAEDISRLGMNTSFRGAPGTPEAVEAFREYMHECATHGIEVIPYLSYGGAGVVPWEPARVRAVAALGDEPNLLAWYVGDDITMEHLDGIRQTVGILREETPRLATVADYIADETPEARTVFTQYIDIRCQYTYPVPLDSIRNYLGFFDKQREFVGDPLWTWVQCFMWRVTARTLKLGIQDGPGPVPEPEQVRMLAHAAINRGVRGLMFFPHHELHLQPELAASVAFVCREVRLFNDHLAAGTTTMNLPSSDPDVNATAFRYGNSTVVSAFVLRDFYHRWMDEAIVGNVTIDVPWPERRLPEALLVATPDVVECGVARGTTPGTVRVTLPSMEIAGFVLLTRDDNEAARLRQGVAGISPAIAKLAYAGSVAQLRKVGGLVWQTGFDHLYNSPTVLLDAMRVNERAVDALVAGRDGDVVNDWRYVHRECRTLLDSMMTIAYSREEEIPLSLRRYLLNPYGLAQMPNVVRRRRQPSQALDPNDSWHFVADWLITGPFPLEGNEDFYVMAPGFERAYPPETNSDPAATFATVDGTAGWRLVQTDTDGGTDFLYHFATTEDVVCYARTTVVALEAMDIDMSLGSNDGAKVWVNGEVVFALHTGRGASPHQDTIPVHLNAGRNDVLVKVENFGYNWALYLSFDDPNRKLRFEAR
jgi:hypothetical protein